MIDIKKACFYDIETHYVIPWEDQPEAIKTAFINHYYDPESYDTPASHFHEVAGLHAEFSHVICVSFGYEDDMGVFKQMALYGSDEVDLLNKVSATFRRFQDNGYFLIGHNIKACDNPYLIKRYIINRLPVPDFINEYGVKPWDSTHLDSMDLWKMGDWKRVSLEVICAALGIQCKSGELGGCNLYTYPIEEMPWDDLVKYCNEDVKSNYLMVKRILEYYDTSSD